MQIPSFAKISPFISDTFTVLDLQTVRLGFSLNPFFNFNAMYFDVISQTFAWEVQASQNLLKIIDTLFF